MNAARVFPVQEPAEWEEEFAKWAEARCAFRYRCFGGLKCLHAHFSEWCLAESVPCCLNTFALLLRSEGFNVRGDLVYGLILKGDWQFLQQRARGEK